jgi:hypothetical protein
MSSDSKPRFSSLLKSSAASRKGLGDETSEHAELDAALAPVALQSESTILNTTPDEQHRAVDVEKVNKRSDKATWKPFSTRVNPQLIKAVNRQLLEEERNFTDLLDELLTKWLHDKTGWENSAS